MKQELEAIRAKALEAIGGAEKAEDLETLRVQYLGKKGELTAVLKQMGSLSAEERPVIGQLANEVRAKLEESVETRTKELAAKALEMKLKAEAVDVTRQTIISLENGRYNASLLLAHKIARYFGLTIEEVFLFEEEST